MTSSHPESVLELEGVDVPLSGIPNIRVLRDVNWRVRSGERWMVRGPARSGKSSILSVAAGLVRPVTGRHRLFGKDLADLGESERMARRLKVGVVFGGGGRLFPTLTVIQNLMLPLRYHANTLGRSDAERVERLMEGLGVTRFLRWWPGDLPRWAAQRVALARALVLAPSVLILDEPTLGLAFEEVAWWRAFWGGRAADAVGPDLIPTTWVVASSDAEEGKAWDGRIARVDSGRWQVDEGSGAELRPAPGP